MLNIYGLVCILFAAVLGGLFAAGAFGPYVRLVLGVGVIAMIFMGMLAVLPTSFSEKHR